MGVRFSLGVLIKFSNMKNIKVKDEEIIVPCDDSINELFICQCNNIEHQLIFSYFSDDEDKDVYVSVHLSADSFWKRIWNSRKYIFGYRCMFWHFDEFGFKKQDAGKLQRVVDFLKS